MPESDKKPTEAKKVRADEKTAGKAAAADKKALLEQKEKSKKILERARKIHAARKAEEAKKAAEERNARMARRAEERKRIEEAKRKAIEKKVMEKKAVSEAGRPGDKVAAVTKAVEPEFVEFAVTARKYKTQLTRKYMARKFWVDPSPYEIQSYIPGTIISVDVKEGKVVQEGTQLLILEAMKMQNKVEMPFTARIKKINVKAGEKVPKDFVMIELEAV